LPGRALKLLALHLKTCGVQNLLNVFRSAHILHRTNHAGTYRVTHKFQMLLEKVLCVHVSVSSRLFFFKGTE
jgi:hypothetical protein